MIKSNSIFSAVAVIFFVTALCFTPALAADTSGSNVPIKITSDKLSYDATGQNVRFSGSVHVVHPDAELWADAIDVILAKSGGASGGKGNENMDPGQIDRIIATGNVRVKTVNNQVGNCQRAEYSIGTGVLTMKGNPVLRDGDNSINGEIIRFFIKENKSEVIGSSDKPVEALFSAPRRVDK